MGLLTQLNKATEPYYQRFLAQLRPFISDWTWGEAHLNARAHAGGKASPRRPPDISFPDRAMLMAALNGGVLREASDGDLSRMHGMVHRVIREEHNGAAD